jgi:NADH-quinone oxidoreductase subunit G
VRYYRDYAGGDDLNAFASRNTVFFGRHEDGVLENEFSGNLVEMFACIALWDATPTPANAMEFCAASSTAITTR